MFKEFPKIPRLFRDIVVTEKIDGTNAQILVVDTQAAVDEVTEAIHAVDPVAVVDDLYIYAGSRNRLLSVANDNFGFARWVQENASALSLLGPGAHYGEWWGSGIQRGYALSKGEKRFSLFNVGRFTTDPNADEELMLIPPVVGLSVVPVLYDGPMEPVNGQNPVREALRRLAYGGSVAAPGFRNPEGVVVYHTHARQYIGKVTLGDDGHKGN